MKRFPLPSRSLPPLVLGTTGALLTWLSWRRWADVLIDFGRELYVPWRLTEGDVLYTDVAWLYGPLSAYVNAALFKLFGVHLTVLVFFNLLTTALLTIMLYALFRNWTNRLLSTIVCITFLTLFGFAHLQEIGNYNFICPYSHSLTHGMCISFAALLCFAKFMRKRRLMWFAMGHALVGVVALCKLEVFDAIACSTVVVWLVWLRNRPADRLVNGKMLIAAVGCMVLPLVVAVVALNTQMPWPDSLEAIFFSWLALLRSDVAANTFHRSIMGIDRIGTNLVQIAVLSAGLVITLAALFFLARRAVGSPGATRWTVAACCAAVAVTTLALFDKTYWMHLLRPLPLLLIGVALGLLFQLRRRADVEQHDREKEMLLVFTTFALVLLLKVLFRVYPYGYGFALAMPGTLISVVAVLDWLPKWSETKGGSGTVMRASLATAFCCVLAWFASTSLGYYRAKTDNFASGGDLLRVDPRDDRAIVISAARRFLETRLRAGDRLVVVPEGVMLNYVMRRPSSIPYYNFDPSVIAVYGEETVLHALRDDPPEYLAICGRDMTEFGVRFFGEGNAEALQAWCMENYRPVNTFGVWPPKSGQFGMMIAEHRRK